MISLTSIEEIVKYQQELLNHQRNQKLIQQETIKLLNSLNKNITFMSDRLDEFANKTNIKLELNDPITAQQQTVDSFFNSCFDSQTNNSIDLKDYLTLNDLEQHQSQQQLVIIQQDSLNTNKISPKSNRTKINKLNNSNSTTNTTSASRTATSDESIDEDLSYDETTDEEEKETIQMRKKPKPVNKIVTKPVGKQAVVNTTILELTNCDNSNSVVTPVKANNKETEECNNQQRFFNKYVRESVEKKLGKDFLLMHEIQEISPDVMEEIKREALQAYPPVNIRPRRAWHLAKASLRCRRRSLRRQKEKQILSTSSDNILSETSHTLNEVETFNSCLQLHDTTKTIIKISSI